METTMLALLLGLRFMLPQPPTPLKYSQSIVPFCHGGNIWPEGEHVRV